MTAVRPPGASYDVDVETTADGVAQVVALTAADRARLDAAATPATQPVSDGGGSLTVDGSVAIAGTPTVNLSATDRAALTAAATPAVQPVSDNGGSLTVDGTVALDAATLAALETITAAISNLPADYPDAATLAKAEQIRALLAGTLAVSGPLTDTQLRATAVPVSGPLTDAQLRAAAVPVSDGGGSLTVDGSVGVTGTASVRIDDASIVVPVGVSGQLNIAPQASEDMPAASGFTGVPILGIRRDTAATQVDADGDFAPVLLDARGRLRVTHNSNAQTVTGTITASAQTVAIDTDQAAVVSVALRGTYAGVNIAFEVSYDAGANWWPIQAQRSDTGAASTTSGVITANATISWDVPTQGATDFRIRSTAYTSGTANVTLLALAVGSDPIVTVIPSGTQTVDSELPAAAALSDTAANPTTPTVGAAMLFWNAATSQWERVRGNSSLTVEASSAKTAATGTGSAQTNISNRGVVLSLNVTAFTGTSLTVRVQAQDPVSGAWFDLPGASWAAVTATTPAPVPLVIYPGVTAVANQAVSLPLPRNWRIAWSFTGTTATWSVGQLLCQ